MNGKKLRIIESPYLAEEADHNAVTYGIEFNQKDSIVSIADISTDLSFVEQLMEELIEKDVSIGYFKPAVEQFLEDRMSICNC